MATETTACASPGRTRGAVVARVLDRVAVGDGGTGLVAGVVGGADVVGLEVEVVAPADGTGVTGGDPLEGVDDEPQPPSTASSTSSAPQRETLTPRR